jgi:hypothetical protein
MALTRDFRETIRERLVRDSKFRKELGVPVVLERNAELWIMQSVFSPAARRRSLVASINAERRGR